MLRYDFCVVITSIFELSNYDWWSCPHYPSWLRRNWGICVAHLMLHVLPWMDIHEPTFTRCRPRPGPGFGPLGWSGLRAQLPIGAKKPSTLDWFGPLQCFKRNLYIMTKNWPKKKYHDQKKKRNLYMYKNEKENILSYIFVNSYTPYVMSCLNWIFFLLYPLFLEINYYAWCKKVLYRHLIISYM